MRYTRYDLKKDKDTKIFIISILTLFFMAFVIGTFVFKVIIKNTGNFGENISESQVERANSNSKYVKFIAVQGGVYRDNNNANAEKNLLAKYGLAFCITDSDKTRVFLGIYPEENGKQIMESLTSQKIDNTHMIFTVNQNSSCNVEITQIINANLKILNKLSESDVKSIKTEDLKKWCSSLKDVESNDNNGKLILKELKEYINKLPQEIEKSNGEQNYIYIFNVLKKVASS
ncbi:hypothetical protein ACJDU8_09345 [Clostridium sp. WILCCON 0269]|uniref:SPOR domain-containing protein n=1 Tax=Candidatus Clostridium eludens TaxID=3381663 RepID=A0ABW8SIP6_9CLOT